MTFLQRISALLLAVTLAVAVGVVPAPKLLLAAPVAQADEPAVLGYFESDVIPGTGDNPDLVVGLVLYEDGSAEVVSDYENGEDVIVEVGTWTENGDGTLTLTVTGTTAGDYAAPIDLDFNVEEDGALVVPGSPTGAFGEAGLTLNPTALGNSEAILAQIPAEALVFQSDVLPAASGPGLQLTLAIFDDGSLTLVSDYLNEGEIVVEVGTWTESEDGGSVSITLTGQVEDGDGAVTEYEAPLEFVFDVNDDGSLALVDEGGALFGEDGLTLFPTDTTGEALEAAADDTADETADETAEEATPEATAETTEEATPEATIEATETPTATLAATPEPTEEVGEEEATTDEAEGAVGVEPLGVYISDLIPGGEGTSSFLVTIFYEDGSILFSTYPLNGEAPITEIGAWVDNGDGTYTIIATGTLEEEYDEPFEVEFTIDEDGIVAIADVMLYPLEDINLAGAPTLVAEFQSDVITDTIDMSHTLTLALYDDFSAELVTDYATTGEVYVEYGEWDIDEANDQLLITVTGDDEVDYEEPVEWLFDVTTEDTLLLANDDEGYYGEDGLMLTVVEMDEGSMTDAEAVEAEEAINEEDAATEDAATEDATTEEPAAEDAATDEEVVDEEADTSEEEAALAAGVQIFQSDVLPAAASPGLQLTLGLLDDGSAALDYDYLNGEEVITNLGEWVDNGDGTITITFTEGPNGLLELPVELTMELDDEGNLVIIDASEESLGFIDVLLAPFALE